jgi:hypothetical protein
MYIQPLPSLSPGRKRALLVSAKCVLQNRNISETVYQIGINYKGQPYELRGCNNDIRNILQPLVSTWS